MAKKVTDSFILNIPSNYPKVSVIILTYNGSRYINGLLGSLYDQTYPSDCYEIVVIDNCSTDDTACRIKEGFPGVKLVELRENLGFARGNNEALKYVSSEYLVFVNQDIICHRGWLEGLMKGWTTGQETGVTVSNMILKDPVEAETLDRVKRFDEIFYFDLSVLGYGYYRKGKGRDVLAKIFSGSSFGIKRDVIAGCGGYLFDETFDMYAEDTELSLRIFNAGYKIRVMRNSVVYHLHSSHKGFDFSKAKIAAGAIINRLCAFYKNMSLVEFVLYYPILVFCGLFKVPRLRVGILEKMLLFLPFGFFSAICMLAGIFKLGRYRLERKRILAGRKGGKFSLLGFIFRRI